MNTGKERVTELGELTNQDLVRMMRQKFLAQRDEIKPKEDKIDKSWTHIERARGNIVFLEGVILRNRQLLSEYFNRTDYLIGICHNRTFEGSLHAMSMQMPLPVSQIFVDTDGVHISRAVEHGSLSRLTLISVSEYWQTEQLLIKRFSNLTRRDILKKLAKSL